MREMVVDLRRLVRQSVEAPAAVLKPLPGRRHKWMAPAAIATLLVTFRRKIRFSDEFVFPAKPALQAGRGDFETRKALSERSPGAQETCRF
jgi:hypothetical protein